MVSDKKIRVMLIDDHPLVTEGLSACLSASPVIEVVATASCPNNGLERARAIKPDVVTIDINMPGKNGLEAAAELKKSLPDTSVIILSMHDNHEYVRRAVNEGVRGYLLKDVSSDEVARAIEAVHQGGLYLCSDVSDALLNDAKGPEKLTDRETEILTALARGSTNKAVAQEFGISERTAETHRKNIKRKLGADTTAALVRYAMERGLTQ